MLKALGLLALASTASAFHCSNDAPTPLDAPKEKQEAMAVMHKHQHDSSAPAPGYATAANYISARHLRGDPPAQPPTLMATPVTIDKVALQPGGRAYAAQNLSLTWMKSLDPDRLLYSFRATANLSTNGAKAYGGWEDPTCLLRGHIAGGHFLSGAALLVNSTGDRSLKTTLYYMIGELAKCQASNTALGLPGYLSAFTVDHFDRLESDTQPIWAPYYTIHKILRGLYDVYTYTGDARTIPIASGMLSYFAGRIRNVIAVSTVSEWYAILNVESGGMGEVARLWYGVTGQADALYVGQAFEEPCWTGPLSLGADVLSSMHANTHIPVVIGAARAFEDTGDVRMGDAVQTFYSTVTTAHSFATGGSSTGEWWGNPHRQGDGLDINGVETCTSYNILKLSRQMFTWSLDTTLMDFWERAKNSGMYGSQHPGVPGAVIYLLPMRGPNGMAGGSKSHTYWGWSDPTESMWCCVGSAMESHSKHGDTLYMTQTGTATPSLLVLQYEPNQLSWPIPGQAAGVQALLTQTATWSATQLSVTITVGLTGTTSSLPFAVSLRIPGWAQAPTATANGQPVSPGGMGGAWFNISASWPGQGSPAATITANFPFTVRLEHLDDDRPEFANYWALLAGPFALGAVTRVDNTIVGDNSSATPAWVRPVSAAERSTAASFGAISYPGGGAVFIRHDNETSLWAAPLSLPGHVTPANGTIYYTRQTQPGFLAAGDDILSGMMTLAQAEAACTANTSCLAFTYQSTDPAPTSPVLVYLKSSVQFSAADGWTTYVSSRVPTDPMGGDEDGPDSTWIPDAPLAGSAAPAGSVSLRSMNRPGEYVVCPAPSAGGQCSIAHDPANGSGPNSAAFNLSATFVLHSPGLTGGAGSVSFESAANPGAYLSWYGAGNATGPAPLTLQPNQAGNSAYASASTFDRSGGPNWLPPTLAYVAHTADGGVAGSRDLLLYPVADMVSEWYGVYLQVQPPQ